MDKQMELNFLSLKNSKNLIKGVILHPLKINQDERGMLIETLKSNWADVFGENLPFNQTYFSLTNPGFARDENLWHVHPTQTDRFVVIKSSIVFAIYDQRENSQTRGILNLFLMGEKNDADNQYLLLIPPKVLHSFCVVGQESVYLLAYPNKLYNPKEEGRVSFKETKAKFPDGSPFSWERIRKEFSL